MSDVITDQTPSVVIPQGEAEDINAAKAARAFSNFAGISAMILRDLNDYTAYDVRGHGFFGKYKKDDIARFLRHPAKFEKELRRAILYVYGASPHFRRIISYFAGLTDWAYYVSPHNIDPQKANKDTMRRNYRKVLQALSSFDIKTQFSKILTVCLREDVYYGTMITGGDKIIIKQLPSDYCHITEIVENVPNVTFDFHYFDSHSGYLKFYPQEFKDRYESYKNDRLHKRFQTLDSPTSFAIKCTNDILSYALPPFAGVLPELYRLEDYKILKVSKLALENYAMVVMKLLINEQTGEWLMDLGKAEDFWRNLDAVLPEEIGSILTPMDVEKISFEKANTGDTNTIADAEKNLFTAAGVSSLLFSNENASANALLLSIKADQMITYGIVKSIGDMLNRYIHAQSYGRYFNVTFIDCSPYNRKELGDQYIKGMQYGLPLISAYAATQGLAQDDLDNMAFLENDVLGLADIFQPLQSSATMSSSSYTGEAGRPKSEDEDLTDSGENGRENGDNWVAV